MLTIVDDTCGRHDTIGGACSCESNTVRYGHHTKHQHACVENFLLGGAAHGLGKRDLQSNVNWFMNVPVEADGTLGIVDGISAPGQVRRAAGRARRARARVELPADQQPLQRLRPDAGADDRHPARLTARGDRPAGAPPVPPRPRRQPGRDRLPHHRARCAGSASSSVAVYSDPDRAVRPRRAGRRGGRRSAAPAAADSYLRADRVVQAARRHRAPTAVHPGYGFLSESAAFARGRRGRGPRLPRPDARPDRRRSATRTAPATWPGPPGVPLLPGTGVLAHLEAAAAEADGHRLPGAAQGDRRAAAASAWPGCDGPDELADAWAAGRRAPGRPASGRAPLFLERFLPVARHVEVQVVGDGRGGVARARRPRLLGAAPQPEGDRGGARARPAPDGCGPRWPRRPARWRASVGYRSVGTVEFLVDPARDEHHFLEVNTRLQVEHGVTELVTGLDLVEWMLRRRRRRGDDPAPTPPPPCRPRGRGPALRRGPGPRASAPAPGCSPRCGSRPASGSTRGSTPAPRSPRSTTRCWPRSWCRGDDRAAAVAAPGRRARRHPGGRASRPTASGRAPCSPTRAFAAVAHGTTHVRGPAVHARRPSRCWRRRGARHRAGLARAGSGYWAVGVPPSGPMDDLSFRLGNRAVGNPEGAAGPRVRGARARPCGSTGRRSVCLAGADMGATLDGAPVARVGAGRRGRRADPALRPGRRPGGPRATCCWRGGVDVPEHLGSRATFTLGGFGGHGGPGAAPGRRPAPRPGDAGRRPPRPAPVPVDERPGARPTTGRSACWTGPHADPDFLTPDGRRRVLRHRPGRCTTTRPAPACAWSARRPAGPAPTAARPACTRRTSTTRPTPSAPSTSPATCRSSSGPTARASAASCARSRSRPADRWKLGQLRAGDTVRFHVATDRRRRDRRAVTGSPARARRLAAPQASPACSTGGPTTATARR